MIFLYLKLIYINILIVLLILLQMCNYNKHLNISCILHVSTEITIIKCILVYHKCLSVRLGLRFNHISKKI